jgi:hypothetical protein
MLESIVDLLDGLFLVAVSLLMVFGVVGSIVVALRAIGRETATPTHSQGTFIDDVSERSIGRLDATPQMRSADNVLKRKGLVESPTPPRKGEHISPTR